MFHDRTIVFEIIFGTTKCGLILEVGYRGVKKWSYFRTKFDISYLKRLVVLIDMTPILRKSGEKCDSAGRKTDFAGRWPKLLSHCPSKIEKAVTFSFERPLKQCWCLFICF